MPLLAISASTPTFCALTPTHAVPLRINSLWAMIQSAGASPPAVTLSHSTTTVPLNFAGSIGRLTTSRVLKSPADVAGSGATWSFPSVGMGAVGV